MQCFTTVLQGLLEYICTIDNTRLIWISNALKNAHNIFNHPHYDALGCASFTSLKFSFQNAQNSIKIVLAYERKILEQF